jgi:hypothetical protein
MNQVLGTCSICRGPVTVPTSSHSMIPPVPRCEQCGAHKREPHGPVIEMERLPIRLPRAIDWSKVR